MYTFVVPFLKKTKSEECNTIWNVVLEWKIHTDEAQSSPYCTLCN